MSDTAKAAAELEELRDSVENLDLYAYEIGVNERADGRRVLSVRLEFPATQLDADQLRWAERFAGAYCGWEAFTAHLTFFKARRDATETMHARVRNLLARIL